MNAPADSEDDSSDADSAGNDSILFTLQFDLFVNAPADSEDDSSDADSAGNDSDTTDSSDSSEYSGLEEEDGSESESGGDSSDDQVSISVFIINFISVPSAVSISYVHLCSACFPNSGVFLMVNSYLNKRLLH